MEDNRHAIKKRELYFLKWLSPCVAVCIHCTVCFSLLLQYQMRQFQVSKNAWTNCSASLYSVTITQNPLEAEAEKSMVATVESIMNKSAQPLYNELYNNLGTPLATSLFYHDAVRSTTGDASCLLLSHNTTVSSSPHRAWPHITLDSNPHEEW